MIFEMFPFIFLITVKFFYLNLNDKKELEILNSNGISNFKIVILLTSISALLGLFLLLFYYYSLHHFQFLIFPLPAQGFPLIFDTLYKSFIQIYELIGIFLKNL